MPSRASIQGTYRGAGITPACPECGSNEHVIRLFLGGGQKVWACSVHYKIKGKMKPQSFKDRLLRRAPEQEEHDILTVLPNRYARRRHGYGETHGRKA